jgi:hypothetical protein
MTCIFPHLPGGRSHTVSSNRLPQGDRTATRVEIRAADVKFKTAGFSRE